MKDKFSIKTLIDHILENHPQMREVVKTFPLTEKARYSMSEMMYKRVFSHLSPLTMASEEDHKTCVIIVEAFMTGYAFGHEIPDWNGYRQ